MPQQADVPVSIQPAHADPKSWGNGLPVLHEIRHGLKRLLDTGESSQIDLSALPFGPGDEARLLDLLGEGEVQAKVEALGPTRVWETAAHGVWIVDHRNLEDERLALHIEITRIPGILCTQPRDIEDAISVLDDRIAAGSDEAT